MQRFDLHRPVSLAWMLVTTLATVFLIETCSVRTASAQTSPRSRAADRRGRPRPDEYRVQQLSPQLEQILRDWAAASGRIQKLQGEHLRYVYDTVFNVEKRAEGVFYYEAPDRGRIDIEGREIPRGEQSQKKNEQTGEAFTLQADRAQRWICTGEEIRQIDDVQKTVEVFRIPPESQGENIMEGPLPFLFGMPPEKAKQRYELKLLKLDEKHAWLDVKPRWKQDAANWREAKVILDRTHYLPVAVKMLDPSGNTETVYTFSKFVINKPQSLFPAVLSGNRDPFNPDLPRDYKIVRKQITPPAQTVAGSSAAGSSAAGRSTLAPARTVENTTVSDNLVTVPPVMNFPYKDAQSVLEKAGFEVKLIRGRPARDVNLTYVVYEQEPAARTRVAPGGVVKLTLYDKPGNAGRSARSPSRRESSR